MNIRSGKNDSIWLAIANVKQREGADLLDGAAGAHVAVFGFGSDDDEFVKAATKLLVALEFNVIELDEVERITIGEFEERVAEDVFAIAMSLNETTPVGYGAFYLYP